MLQGPSCVRSHDITKEVKRHLKLTGQKYAVNISHAVQVILRKIII